MSASAAKMADLPKNVKKRILILHGPNLNLLGSREPEVYGKETLADVDARLKASGRKGGAEVQCYQHNVEGELVSRVHRARAENVGFIIINPAGYTHTSVALRDALA